MQAGMHFRDYFETELAQLRGQAVEFGADHPAAAKTLGLSKGRSSDPQVELLMQSFAFLTGRLRHQLDRDAALVPNALMSQLYPHLEAPVPSLTIAEAQVGSETGGVTKADKLDRNRSFYATARDDAGRSVRCRMSNCSETPLVPLKVTDIQQITTAAYPTLPEALHVQSVLKLTLKANGPVAELGINKLRFYLDIEDRQVWQLYELLALQLIGVTVAKPGNQLEPIQTSDAFRWLGFDEAEAALATDRLSHPGYRLVQEYFAFPEKFLFFELSGLRFSGDNPEAELLLLLSTPVDKTLVLGPQILRLNCLPLVNLFMQRIEPVPLDQTQFEYRLSGDHAHHRHTEIYQVESLTAIRPNEPPRPIAPYFSLDGLDRIERQTYFHLLRRVESTLASVPGTETYVSFLDTAFEATRPVDEVIGGRALCTNRRLAEQLRVGDAIQLEGPGPVKGLQIVSKPTPHQTPTLLGGQPWTLMSQLLLNHLSLGEGRHALAALKSMLRLHLGRASLLGTKQIDCLTGMRVQPILQPIQQMGRRALVEGLHITLEMDRTRFEGGSPVLFTEIMRRFFALYASVNTVTQLSLELHDLKGKLKTWPPMVGEQIVL